MKKTAKGLSLTMVLALMLTPVFALTSAQAEDETEVSVSSGDNSDPVGDVYELEELDSALPPDPNTYVEGKGYWVEAFYHENHWHEGFWSPVKVAGDARLEHVGEATKVYSRPGEGGEVLTTLPAGAAICPFESVGDGWVHIYYNDGDNAGWIYTG